MSRRVLFEIENSNCELFGFPTRVGRVGKLLFSVQEELVSVVSKTSNQGMSMCLRQVIQECPGVVECLRKVTRVCPCNSVIQCSGVFRCPRRVTRDCPSVRGASKSCSHLAHRGSHLPPLPANFPQILNRALLQARILVT